MANFNYFEQYQSEHKRIREKIQAEENPVHREHLIFIEQMIDDQIKSEVPALIQSFSEKERTNIEVSMNGKPTVDANLVQGVRNMVVKALKRMKFN